jgi:hypothetical protein
MFELLVELGQALGVKIVLGLVLIVVFVVLAFGCRYFLRDQVKYARPNHRIGERPPDEKVPLWQVK